MNHEHTLGAVGVLGTLALILLAVTFPGQSLAQESPIWHCLRAGTDTPDDTITELTPEKCGSYFESSTKAYGTAAGAVYLVYPLSTVPVNDSPWITIPAVKDGTTVELNFIPDTGATSGDARIQVRHTTDKDTRGVSDTNGTKVLLNATLTGADPYASISGIPPGQIQITTSTDPAIDEESVVELRVTKSQE